MRNPISYRYEQKFRQGLWFLGIQRGFSLPETQNPMQIPFQEARELIVTYLKMKEKIYLNKQTPPKMRKNEVSVGF